ncbi:MAG TPA: CocE/NonD family hydrolase [Anaerolineae bacterium]|nr:CocE/NonD family hydrolase [Anaerolineae bacterium]HIQ06601.1 CocE/NonD family hydrolase [Anaerolineae bacterium]
MGKSLIVERDVEVNMRDGVILRADVYRPDSEKPCPVLLQRTPYGKGFADHPAFALMAAERGYAVVIQDTRGRWASDGDGYPFIHEKNDGYDTVEWIAHQPWCNGKVGMYGSSYVGYTQWAAAVTQPPALKTIIPTVTFCDPHAIIYVGGALALGVTVSWNLMSTAFMNIQKLQASQEEKDRLMAQLIEAADGMARGETFSHLPLVDMPLIGREGIVPFFRDLLSPSSSSSDLWMRIRCAHEQVRVPALHIGGWYDIFIANTLHDFVGIRENGGSEEARAHQKLIIGPWLHGPLEGVVGEVDFGVRASSLLVLPEEVQLRWFDYWLKGEENGIMDEPPMRIFVMGDNQWRTEYEWPLARTQYVPYYLHSSGAANSLHGDGMLSPEKPSDEPVDTYVYDPRNPVPTHGGGLCCWRAALAPGAFDQRDIEARPDVLVYTTPPLADDVEITGPIKVHLWAATSAPDTDFTAKLVDVSPDGYARNVQDGIIRARYRESFDEARLVTPGEVYEYVIDLAATSNVFKAGHRIRIEISSSNFPRFDRSLNTGHPVGQDTELRMATQTILHDASHPSHIVLPIIPR